MARVAFGRFMGRPVYRSLLGWLHWMGHSGFQQLGEGSWESFQENGPEISRRTGTWDWTSRTSNVLAKRSLAHMKMGICEPRIGWRFQPSFFSQEISWDARSQGENIYSSSKEISNDHGLRADMLVRIFLYFNPCPLSSSEPFVRYETFVDVNW
jgi:hypothetical protein